MNIEKTYKLHIKENIFELTEEEISALYETCRKALNISYVGPIPSKPNDNPIPTPTYPNWPTYPGIVPYKDWLVTGNCTGTNSSSIPTITSTENFFTDNPQNDEQLTKTFINNQTISDNKDKSDMYLNPEKHTGGSETKKDIEFDGDKLVKKSVKDYDDSLKNNSEPKLESLEEHNNSKLNNAYGGNLFKTGIACPKCGSELHYTNPGIMLTSYPPRKPVNCKNCKHNDYVY